MKKAAVLIAVFVVAAVLGHIAVAFATPYVIMGEAMKRISRGGQRINTWTHSPPTTEASRAVVRPSPDLAYSSCVYDLSHGPVRVTAAPGAGDYMSVSVFQANTDNIYVVNDRQAPAGVNLVLVRKGDPEPPAAKVGPATVVWSPSAKGIVLERRLAPNAAAFAAAAAARKDDVCAPL